MTAAGTEPADSRFMTASEVATVLRVSPATIYRLVRTGVLPGLRVGHSLRLSRSAVEQFMVGDKFDGS